MTSIALQTATTRPATVKRGRPAANDNTDQNAAAKAERSARVRALKSQGLSFREIADKLSLSHTSISFALNGRPARRERVAANDNKVIRLVANNGGCSTTSGMVEVSLPRVPTIDGVAA